MKAVIQRVSQGRVTVDGQVVAEIGKGLVILLGVAPEDTLATVEQMTEKIAHLRIFEDDEGKMNLSALDVDGEAIVVSQFTLYADTRRGRRPSFIDAAKPEIAEPLVEACAEQLSALKPAFSAHTWM
jgi:D-tyrosyl-tRNA(Tyr) deacylase